MKASKVVQAIYQNVCMDFRPSRHGVLRADFVLEGPEMPWTSARPPKNPAQGQRKLWYVDMLAVLEAYARVLENGNVDAQIDVVVAGAGPGYHFARLVDCFPASVNWHLYDPGFDGNAICTAVQAVAARRKNVFVNTGEAGFMTETVAGALRTWIYRHRKRSKVLFVSDIRTVPARDSDDYEAKRRVRELEDMRLQLRLAEALRADFAMLKVKIPYPDEGTSNAFEYAAGVCFIQPLCRALSSEFRLFVERGADGRFPMRYYYKLHNERAWSYYNRVVRPGGSDREIMRCVDWLYERYRRYVWKQKKI